MTTTIHWFRRDLRLADNSSLAAAITGGSVTPVYIHAPDEEAPWQPGAASRWWLHHSLAALDASLRALGSRLVIRRGPALAALEMLVRETGATEVHWSRLYDPAIVARDTTVKAGLTAMGVVAESHAGHLLFEPWAIRNGSGDPYRVFTPFWRNCSPRLDGLPPPRPAPASLPAVPPGIHGETLESLGLLPRIRWADGLAAAWTPGEDGAAAEIDRFTAAAIADYKEHRDRPDLAGTSRLSPHLHFGEVSPGQVLATVHAATQVPGPASFTAGAESFVRELGWREFGHHLLYHFPHTTDEPLDARFAGLEWRDDPESLRRWQRGQTGIPIVDAGMRELWHTGWMHNRVRMIVASLLTKNLFTRWQHGARWFWDTLVDADLANNTAGWQWTAGCGADAAPYYRVFSPLLQAERFDPERSYLRRWLPELARLPDNWIHQPWDAPEAVLAAAGVELGRDYPLPLVDLRASRNDALLRFERLKAGR